METISPANTQSKEPAASYSGLSTEEASRRLAHYGLNEPVKKSHRTAWHELLALCTNPLVIILLLAAVIAAGVGEFVNSSIIVTIVALSITLDFFQTYRSERALSRLRAHVAVTCTVLRDGKWIEILVKHVVPGDLIRLGYGDMVPADAQILTAKDLHLQEAALTGESLPVEKVPTVEATASENNASEVYFGTSVVSGLGTAMVIRTGALTKFSEIAVRLAQQRPETEFELGLRKFGALIMRTVVLLVLFVSLVMIVLRHDPLESLLFALALAVGLTPEFLPMITTVTLAKGAQRMAKEHVIVKHLPAIQNFGSIDVLCSDKTGTLTTGTMQVTSSLDPLGAADPKPLALAYLNSYFQTAALHGNGEPERQTSHNPLDNAILNAQCNRESGYEKLDEIPFDFERRRVSVVLSKAGLVTLITKGAPESLFPICEQCECAGKLVPLNDRKEQILKTFENLCQQGLRAVGVAYRDLSAKPAFSKDDEHGLVFAGFVTFLDPPAPGVTETLTQLRRDGVRVKVLTGDNEMVAAHICSQVGLNGNRIIVGRELETMSAPALAHAVEQTDIFARVSPAQKERILLALKSRKHVVGFLGDGINDAPSLHAADVGITVSSAVDVAKEAADIVLTKPGLKVLHLGILEGRRAFGNVMKYLLMGTSSNFGNMFSMAAASVFLRFLPMLPTQILLNNFLYDLAQITIPTDSVDPSYIRKPRRWDIGQIRRFMLYIGPISSIYDFLTFFVLLRVFHASEKLFHTGWFVESLATQTFVLFIIRTMGNPLRSRPSRPLAVTTIVAVLVGLYLPFSPLAAVLGFVPLPIGFFGFLLFATTTYLLLVEIAKRRILRA